ncbi:hypothetical protein ACIBF5_17390 [Micromonospora sp. NPDC050417]|uniref:hypothetical protein n=1 Tax=Micromonospora sp. NPDC050417 TaxID=3364280 RepID=UPI00378ED83A
MLHLTDDPPDGRASCGNCPDLDGDAEVRANGRTVAYEVWGDPRNYTGSRFELHLRPVEEVTGPRLDGFDGEWTGDLLAISTSVTVVGADGVVRSTSDGARPIDPPIRFELRRSSKAGFAAAC